MKFAMFFLLVALTSQWSISQTILSKSSKDGEVKSSIFSLNLNISSYRQINSIVSGTVVYNNSANTILRGIIVKLMMETTPVGITSTNADGFFSFWDIQPGNYTIEASTTIPWGGVTATDALKMKRHIASLELLTEPIRLTAADVNNSGSVNSTDVLKVQRRIASLDNSFVKGDWIFEKVLIGGNTITVNYNNMNVNLYGLCTGDINGSYIPVSITVPIVNTTSISNIAQTTAIGGGDVTNDGGASIIERGVCWNLLQNPTIADSHTSDGTGNGSFISILTGLLANTLYYVRAYAINSAGISYSSEISFITAIANCGTVTDYDSNTYNTVIIGSQCWMKENLKAIHYSNGTAMIDGTGAIDDDVIGNYITKYYFDYGDNPENTIVYGKLYSWAALMNGAISSATNPSSIQGICPTGWHVPSDLEWTQLTDFLGGESVAGGKMKEVGTTHWITPNTGADNRSGFTGLPNGYRNDFGPSLAMTFEAYWWSATEFAVNKSWLRTLNSSYSIVDKIYYDKAYGHGVRCLRD